MGRIYNTYMKNSKFIFVIKMISIKFMTLPMKNNEEYQNMQYQTYVKCGHKISDITKKLFKSIL